MKFEVTILGCGSATPTLVRNSTAQYVNVLERHFLIDCGEGTQIQLRKNNVRFQRINHIFISHLHGDHYLGLVGLISTLHLLGRKQKLYVYGPNPLGDIIIGNLKASQSYLSFELEFVPLESKESQLIFEDNLIEIRTIPLEHRIYCNGFLIKEKIKDRRIDKSLIDEYQIPVAMFSKLKKGEDWVKDDGSVIKNEVLTLPPVKSRSYAFCTDTKALDSIIPIIEGADLLYHEATFLHKMKSRAEATFHTTALQAGELAAKAKVKKLIIGHYSARYKEISELEEEAKQAFENTTAIDDGDVINIPNR